MRDKIKTLQGMNFFLAQRRCLQTEGSSSVAMKRRVYSLILEEKTRRIWHSSGQPWGLHNTRLYLLTHLGEILRHSHVVHHRVIRSRPWAKKCETGCSETKIIHATKVWLGFDTFIKYNFLIFPWGDQDVRKSNLCDFWKWFRIITVHVKNHCVMIL